MSTKPYLSMTSEELLRKVENEIAQNPAASPIEAQWILEHFLGSNYKRIQNSSTTILDEQQIAPILEAAKRRANCEPLQYILGNVPFHEVTIQVGPGVLIPRPETEELVEHAIRLYQHKGDILDICTGSGAIAIALAHHFRQVQVHASDISAEALHYAKTNARNNQLTNIQFYQGDLLTPIQQLGRQMEMITANPPYISFDEYQHLEPDVLLHEPQLALTDQHDGFDFIERIAKEAKQFLMPNGILLCEIGEAQGERSRQIFEFHQWKSVEILKDLSHRDRIILAKL